MTNAPGYRAGAGGKIVTNRRRQRLAETPYDRPLPPPPPPPPPPPGSPNWFTGVLIPTARAIASGAGKILSSAIFSDSESSSSEDLDSVSEDDIDNVNEQESPHGQVNVLNKEKLTSSEMVQQRQESQFIAQGTETKLLIERLIMKENFSREECDRLTKVLNSRVMDWSIEAGEKMSLVNSPVQTVDHVDANESRKAVMEAKKWFQEKKGGSSSVMELAHGNCNPNSTVFDHIEAEVGSPVDVARSYMKNKPPWASPKEHVELRTPTMKLFKEGTPYSDNHDILSSSKRRNSHASGSWNIQEELRKVRSKAIDDMLRTPPTREQGAGKAVIGVGERISELHSFWKTKPIDTLRDVGVSSDPALVVLALSASERQDGNVSDAPSSKPDASVSGNNVDIEAIRIDGECAPSKFPYPAVPNHAVEQHPDPHSTKINGPSADFGGRLHLNGFSTSQASLSPGENTVQKNEQYNDENHNDHTVSEIRHTNTIDDEGNCELLSETYVEVPIANETNSIESNSQISLDVHYEESQIQPSTEEVMTGNQRARKPGRRGRGRGRGK